jgi:predicted dehydrogenase
MTESYAKRAVDDGSLGLLHTVCSTTMDPAPSPMEYTAGSGGIFRDCAVHDFDVLRPAHHFFMDRFAAAFRAELSAFVDVVNGTAAPACTVADAVDVAWLAEAATESLQRGVRVRIEDVRSL